jgi:C4-dicarboxylate-specific signal transduction histidine kinase
MAVILLNFFYVFVVNQLTDLNSIASILKRQDETKNKVLQISSLQSDRRRSRTSFEAIGKTESILNFQKTGVLISTLVDSVTIELKTLSQMTVTVFRTESDRGPYMENSRKLQLSLEAAAKYNMLFETSFKDFTDASIDSIKHTPNKIPGEKAKALSNILDLSDQKVSQSLREITAVIDDQTKIVIQEIGHRIDEVKRRTIFILSGIVIIAIGFAFIFSRGFTNSMRRLKESAGAIGQGKFDFDPKGYPNDEIGDLAAAFFEMSMDLKTAQEELVKSRRLAAIGEVVASVNHEINNPLMIISGNAQFLEMSMAKYPAEMRERVQTILEETERISSVTRKLREIKNPVVEDYTASGEQMINLDKSTAQ